MDQRQRVEEQYSRRGRERGGAVRDSEGWEERERNEQG